MRTVQFHAYALLPMTPHASRAPTGCTAGQVSRRAYARLPLRLPAPGTPAAHRRGGRRRAARHALRCARGAVALGFRGICVQRRGRLLLSGARRCRSCVSATTFGLLPSDGSKVLGLGHSHVLILEAKQYT